MGKKSIYCLIKRDKKTNDFEIVPVDGKIKCSLEEIDLKTVGHNLDFVMPLEDKDISNYAYYDWFIVSVSGTGKNIKYYELPVDSDYIRTFAKESLEGSLSSCRTQIDTLFSLFSIKMQNFPEYKAYVLQGNTDIFEKFLGYFIKKGHVNYHQDGEWAYKSYPLIRSVAGALTGDFGRRNLKEGEKRLRDLSRSILEKRIIQEIDPKHDDNQISFADKLEVKVNDNVLGALTILEMLNEHTFIIDNGKVIFNSLPFSNITKKDLNILEGSLPEEVRLMIMYFLLHRNLLSKFSDNDRVKKMICRDIETIGEWLSEDSTNLYTLNKWFEIYGKYIGKEIGDRCAGYQKEKKQGTN